MMPLGTTVWIDGKTLTLRRLNPGLDGAVSSDHQVEARVGDGEAKVFDCHNRDVCYAASKVVSEAIWGLTKPGRRNRGGEINATNSMVWEITNLFEQIAGC